jgi:hypothetical protein
MLSLDEYSESVSLVTSGVGNPPFPKNWIIKRPVYPGVKGRTDGSKTRFACEVIPDPVMAPAGWTADTAGKRIITSTKVNAFNFTTRVIHISI